MTEKGKRWWMWTWPSGGTYIGSAPSEADGVKNEEVRVLPIHDGDLLTPKEREAVEAWRHYTEPRTMLLIAALDRLAPAPVPAWKPEYGDRVKWHRGEEFGTGTYVDKSYEVSGRKYEVDIAGVPIWVDSIEPLQEPTT